VSSYTDENGNTRGLLWTVVHRAPWWVPWLFMFLLWMGWAFFQFTTGASSNQITLEVREQVRATSIEQCERVNDLRAQTNTRSEILRQVLNVATESALSRDDTSTAREFLHLSQQIEDIPLVTCEEAFPEDMVRAGFNP
jgi:hypothetical protein